MRNPLVNGQRNVLSFLLLTIVAMTAAPAAPRVYPGVISLGVDVSDVQRRIFRVTEIIPVRPGPLQLHYPQWLPGEHSALGTIDQLAGLRFRAGERELAWQRDPLDVFRFTLQIPAGVTAITAEFQVATPQPTSQGAVVVAADMLVLKWNQVLLYPAGIDAQNVSMSTTLRLPQGWRFASALPLDAGAGNVESGNVVHFASVPLEVLVDSPLLAGRLFRQLDLAPAGGVPMRLNIVAHDAADLAATDAQISMHRALVRETYAALGPPHYDHYDFLLALADNFADIGLEHHRSSENVHSAAHFRNWDEDVYSRDLLAHEFVHSWNGKYRRPARLWTPDFNTPMQNELLWVYEGMTQYYGQILATRSGLWSADFARDALAATAAVFDRKRPGRSWRSLQDTTFQPLITPRQPLAWTSWQRTEDYYTEGALLWLDVDTKLRELTQGRRSLDDFARTFLAAPANHGMVSTYEFADVVKALNSVAVFDWESLLRQRIDGTNQPFLEGLQRAGFRLMYDDKPNAAIHDIEQSAPRTDLSYSLGLVVSGEGELADVVWDGPAFKAGLVTGTALVAVNGRTYSPELLKQAVTLARGTDVPVELLVRDQDLFRTVRIDYHEGLQYPHLAPIEGRADGLAALLAASAPPPPVN